MQKRSSTEHIKETKELGAISFIKKPIYVNEIISAIRLVKEMPVLSVEV